MCTSAPQGRVGESGEVEVRFVCAPQIQSLRKDFASENACYGRGS